MRRSAPEPALDAGGKRSDIATNTGVVIGVANASLSIERVEISVLMGLSGCDPATLRRIRRLRIAMVFQQFGLLPWRTVRDNVGLGLELRGDSADERRRIIDQHLDDTVRQSRSG